MARSVLLLINRSKPDAAAAAKRVRELVAAHGARITAELDADMGEPYRLTEPADLAVVLGGDGTLLSQAYRCAGLGIPLLGVNLGKLGFMAEFDIASLEAQAATLFDGHRLPTRELPLIGVDVIRAHGDVTESVGEALNDAVITAGPPYRLIRLSLSIDGEPGPTLSGDGLVISTPIGSTAYNLATGGPIVAPGTRAVAISAIAAHSLAFRPIVVPDTASVRVLVERHNRESGEQGTTLVIDGQPSTLLTGGDVVKFRHAGRTVSFVTNPKGSYWATLLEKLNWAQAPRFRGEG